MSLETSFGMQINKIRRGQKMPPIKNVLPLLFIVSSHLFASNTVEPQKEPQLYKDKNFALGVGISVVKFDTNIKSSSKVGNRSIYFDVEGNFNLPEISTVYSLYGAYRFNKNHSILMNYFSINRSSKVLSVDESYGDVASVKADVAVYDRSKFFNISYGYNLFRDSSGIVTLLAGLNAINLAYKIEMNGAIMLDNKTIPKNILFDENLFVPLPLIGLNFRYNYTKDFAVSTDVSFVAGAYKNVKAGILQTNFNVLYNITDHVGLLLGITYFDADIVIEKETLEHKVVYGYKGATAGLHFAF